MVFVVVAFGNVDLANPLQFADTTEIRHHSSFDAPIGWESKGAGDIRRQTDLAADRIPEEAEGAWGFLESREGFHGLKERCQKKAHDSTVEAA